MPFLNIKLSVPESTETSVRVAQALTTLTAEILRKKRELTAVEVEYVAPSRWFIGGTSLHEQTVSSFYLDIKVTAGTNTKDEKAQYVTAVFSAIEAIVGPLNPASYIVVHELNGDAWGYQGQTQEFRYIKGKPL